MKKLLILFLLFAFIPTVYAASVITSGANIQDNTVTSAKLIDNNVSGSKILDNTLNGSKVIDNTLTISKLAMTGTGSSATYIRSDGFHGTPSIATSTAILSSYKNLKITTPADNQSVTITADHVVATDNGNLARIVSTVSLTVNLDVAGANGLDNGTIAANIGYFLYVIDNGATTAGLASTSATAPVMPSGYTYKALVGWCTTDNTATPFNIEEFTQIDDEYAWRVPQVTFPYGAGSVTTSALNLAAGGVLAYAIIPPTIVKVVVGKIRAGANAWFYSPETFANSQSIYSNETYGEFLSLNGGNEGIGQYKVPIVESQKFYHQTYNNATTHVWVSGFTLKR